MFGTQFHSTSNFCYFTIRTTVDFKINTKYDLKNYMRTMAPFKTKLSVGVLRQMNHYNNLTMYGSNLQEWR